MFPLLVLQAKVAPTVLDDPFNVTELIVQLSSLSAPALAAGDPITVTVALQVAELPAASLTVSTTPCGPASLQVKVLLGWPSIKYWTMLQLSVDPPSISLPVT